MNWTTFTHWLLQPHVYVTAAVAAILLWEHWLSRTKRIASNSTLEIAGNALVALGKLWIPGVQAEVATADEAITKAEAPAPKPTTPPGAALALALVGLALGALGCGPTAYQMAQQSVTAADQVQIDAYPGARAFLKAYEQTIVNKANANGGDSPAVQAELLAFHAVADKVIASFGALKDACQAAKAGVDALGAGKIDALGIAALLGRLYAVALDLYQQAKALGLAVPGLDKLIPANAYTQPPPTSCRLKPVAWAVA